MNPNPHVYPGQRVITAGGVVRHVAYVTPDGRAFVFEPDGSVRAARVAFDAFGGEPELPEGAAFANCRVSPTAGPPPQSPRCGRPSRHLRVAA